MKPVRRVATTLFALLLLGGAALAASHSVGSLGLSFDVPDDWKTIVQHETLMAKRGTTGLLVRASDEATLDAAIADAKKNVGRLIPNGKLGARSESTIAGQKATRFVVTGGPKEMKMTGHVTIAKLPNGKVAVAVAMGPAAEFKAASAAVDKVLATAKIDAAK